MFFSENGRVEGLILNKSPIEDNRRTRPRSAKGGKRTISRDGRYSAAAGDVTFRTVDIDTINEKGVQELFSDILYDDPDENLENAVEYKDDFEDIDEENTWSDDSPHPYCRSATSFSRADNFQYLSRLLHHLLILILTRIFVPT